MVIKLNEKMIKRTEEKKMYIYMVCEIINVYG